MAKIVITGAAGFIGSALLWGLNKQGRNDILVVDTLGTDDSWKNLVNVQFADYIDRDDFICRLEQGKFDKSGAIEGIIHMGACSSTTERDMGFLIRNNYEYTKRLALWCVKHQKRFVYASSAATYGDGSKGFVDNHEQLASLEPLNGYGFSKYLFDLWALRNNLLGSILGLKFFNVFGPNEYHKGDMRSVVHKAYGQISKSGKMKLFKSYRDDYKDGWQLRDFVYIKDVVAAVLSLYNNRDAMGIFNVGTGKARSFYDLTAAVFAAMGRKVDIDFIEMPEPIREKYQYYTQADTTKLQKYFAQPMHTLEDAVTDYVQNYLMGSNAYLS